MVLIMFSKTGFTVTMTGSTQMSLVNFYQFHSGLIKLFQEILYFIPNTVLAKCYYYDAIWGSSKFPCVENILQNCEKMI